MVRETLAVPSSEMDRFSEERGTVAPSFKGHKEYHCPNGTIKDVIASARLSPSEDFSSNLRSATVYRHFDVDATHPTTTEFHSFRRKALLGEKSFEAGAQNNVKEEPAKIRGVRISNRRKKLFHVLS